MAGLHVHGDSSFFRMMAEPGRRLAVVPRNEVEEIEARLGRPVAVLARDSRNALITNRPVPGGERHGRGRRAVSSAVSQLVQPVLVHAEEMADLVETVIRTSSTISSSDRPTRAAGGGRS